MGVGRCLRCPRRGAPQSEALEPGRCRRARTAYRSRSRRRRPARTTVGACQGAAAADSSTAALDRAPAAAGHAHRRQAIGTRLSLGSLRPTPLEIPPPRTVRRLTTPGAVGPTDDLEAARPKLPLPPSHRQDRRAPQQEPRPSRQGPRHDTRPGRRCSGSTRRHSCRPRRPKARGGRCRAIGTLQARAHLADRGENASRKCKTASFFQLIQGLLQFFLPALHLASNVRRRRQLRAQHFAKAAAGWQQRCVGGVRAVR